MPRQFDLVIRVDGRVRVSGTYGCRESAAYVMRGNLPLSVPDTSLVEAHITFATSNDVDPSPYLSQFLPDYGVQFNLGVRQSSFGPAMRSVTLLATDQHARKWSMISAIWWTILVYRLLISAKTLPPTVAELLINSDETNPSDWYNWDDQEEHISTWMNRHREPPGVYMLDKKYGPVRALYNYVPAVTVRKMADNSTKVALANDFADILAAASESVAHLL